MTEDLISQIPGAIDLVAWFGRFSRLHDANVTEFQINGDGQGHLKAKAFRMTDKVDSKGFYILEKHCFVTLHFDEITAIRLEGFERGQAIIFDIEISQAFDEFVVTIGSSYGFEGSLKMRRLSITLEPIDMTT